jgi:hypothetical protein
MATWPSSARVLLAGYSESDSPISERVEMDRGIPKQRRTQSDVVITASMTLSFKTYAQAEAFADWYYSASGGAAGMSMFDWQHPRTGETVQARIVANTLGPLQSVGPLRIARRTLQIEYVKALTL